MARPFRINLTLLIALPLVALALLPSAASAAFPGQNGRIQFSRRADNGAAHVYSIDPSGHNERQLTFGLNALDEDGSWSPDGNRIVFQRCSDPSGTSCGIVVMNADGSGGATLTPIDGGNYDDYPVFSPDASKIAFIRQTGPSCCDVMVMNADGSDAHSIRPMYNDTITDGPSWSPDGTRIAYTDPSGGLAVTNADGSGAPLPLHSPSSFYDETSDWSLDGSRIIFSAAGTNASGYFRIWSVPSDGSAPATELDPSDDPAHHDEPSFSPDGTKILFEKSFPNGNEPIYMMDSSGSGAVRVTGDDGFTYRATWQPLHLAPPAPPAPPAVPFAGISLSPRSVTVSSSGIALISESCPAFTKDSCAGTLTLKTAGRVAASAAKKKHRKVTRRVVTLGHAKFTIAAGKTARVRVRLSHTALAILRSSRKLSVRATVVSHDGSGAAKTSSVKFTLRAPKARKHHTKGHR